VCVLRYNQSKRIKLGPIKNRNEFIKRDKYKGIRRSKKKEKKGLVIPSYDKELVNECG